LYMSYEIDNYDVDCSAHLSKLQKR